MKEKIYLGIQHLEYSTNERIYLSKHSWDCDWYWGLGYVGNRNTHFHFETYLKDGKLASELFTDCNFTDSNWWIIRDLFVQAYALKEVAAVYRHGGFQSGRKGITDLLKSEEKAKQANDDLKLILDTLWDFMLNNNLGKV